MSYMKVYGWERDGSVKGKPWYMLRWESITQTTAKLHKKKMDGLEDPSLGATGEQLTAIKENPAISQKSTHNLAMLHPV